MRFIQNIISMPLILLLIFIVISSINCTALPPSVNAKTIIFINSSTHNLSNAWIWIDGVNRTQRIPASIYVNKPGKHNVTLMNGNITFSQYIPVNESLSDVEINLHNNTTKTLLRYD